MKWIISIVLFVNTHVIIYVYFTFDLIVDFIGISLKSYVVAEIRKLLGIKNIYIVQNIFEFVISMVYLEY